MYSIRNIQEAKCFQELLKTDFVLRRGSQKDTRDQGGSYWSRSVAEWKRDGGGRR